MFVCIHKEKEECEMETQIVNTDRGFIYRIGSERTHIPSELMVADETKIGTEKLNSAINILITVVDKNTKTYKSEMVATENARMARNVFVPAFKAAHAALRDESRAYSVADAKAHEAAPLVDATWEAAERARIAAMPTPARFAAVIGLSFSQSSALLRHGDLDRLGLPDEVRSSVLRRHALLGHIERTGMRADFAKAPTVNNPLPSGVDEAGAMRAAELALRAHEARGARLEAAGTMLADAARLYAVATGATVEDAWRELAG